MFKIVFLKSVSPLIIVSLVMSSVSGGFYYFALRNTNHQQILGWRGYSRLFNFFAAVTVFSTRHAIVMGPAPPGTGVIQEAFLLTFS